MPPFFVRERRAEKGPRGSAERGCGGLSRARNTPAPVAKRDNPVERIGTASEAHWDSH